jgi:L(+)-tartrate dehydratase alpha subunit
MDKELAVQSLTDTMAKFTAYIGKRLPKDVKSKLIELKTLETNPLAKSIYDSMDENQEAADRHFPLLGELQEILREATEEATRTGPLRHNAVETFDEKNTGTNTGTQIPWLDWRIVPEQDTCTIDVYMAGGGCTLPGAAKVLMPGQGYEGVAEFVMDVITERGVNACPPLLVGVGVSTSVETAARLSKLAIMRPVDSRSDNPRAALMEDLLEQGLNEIGIGPQGLTGNNSVMGVNIESSARHPSTIGVAVNTGCWAHRRGKIKINPDMSYEILSHEGVVL